MPRCQRRGWVTTRPCLRGPGRGRAVAAPWVELTLLLGAGTAKPVKHAPLLTLRSPGTSLPPHRSPRPPPSCYYTSSRVAGSRRRRCLRRRRPVGGVKNHPLLRLSPPSLPPHINAYTLIQTLPISYLFLQLLFNKSSINLCFVTAYALFAMDLRLLGFYLLVEPDLFPFAQISLDLGQNSAGPRRSLRSLSCAGCKLAMTCVRIAACLLDLCNTLCMAGC